MTQKRPMPPKKRPHRPKVKGCYECSQRRIHCDRTSPECQKCIKKGLKCSGLGIRYRFNNGVASRGDWAGKTMKVVYQEMDAVPMLQDCHFSTDPETTAESHNGHNTPTNDYDPLQSEVASEILARRSECDVASEPSPLYFPQEYDPWLLLQLGATSPQPYFEAQAEGEVEAGTCYDVSDTTTSSSWSTEDLAMVLRPYPESIPGWKIALLYHYSEHIAREMLSIDGPHNGWRHLVLPIAHNDDLVMDAVLAVSTLHCPPNIWPHMYGQVHRRHDQPYNFYARAISGLKERSQLQRYNGENQLSILLTILLLLTSVMVTGHSDFPILFHMLQSALVAIGGDSSLGNGELAEFVVRQIHKLSVYAAPLLGEETGVKIISDQTKATQVFDCLNYCLQRQPEHGSTISVIRDLVSQACEIYLHNAQHELPSSSPSAKADVILSGSIARVQRFKETLESIPPGSMGAHVLVWPCFVAAADSILDEHKTFFRQVLLRHYARSGFRNLIAGIDALDNIWSRDPGQRWTALLPQIKLFIA